MQRLTTFRSNTGHLENIISGFDLSILKNVYDGTSVQITDYYGLATGISQYKSTELLNHAIETISYVKYVRQELPASHYDFTQATLATVSIPSFHMDTMNKQLRRIEKYEARGVEIVGVPTILRLWKDESVRLAVLHLSHLSYSPPTYSKSCGYCVAGTPSLKPL